MASGALPPGYSTDGIKVPASDCGDIRALLTVVKRHSAEAEKKLKSLLKEHPELHPLGKAPTVPGEILIERGIYGSKSFGQPATLEHEAVVARCFDIATCLHLAALYRAIAPEQARRVDIVTSVPSVICGQPNGLSDQLQPIRALLPTP